MFFIAVKSFNDLMKADKWINDKIDNGFNLSNSGFWKGLGNSLLVNLNQNYLLTFGIFAFVFVILYFIFGREKEGDVLYNICKKIQIVFLEKTDQPVLARGGKVKIDKLGKKVLQTIEHVPKFNWEKLPTSFVISNVHASVKGNLFQFTNGLLVLLKENNFIEYDSGSIAGTGYPGEYLVSLHDRKMLDQRAMFKEIRWHKEEVINGITRDYYPEIIINEKEVIIKLPEELKINDDIIRRGLETFSRFFELKIKTHYDRSSDQSMIFFKYQTELKKFFNGKDTIPKCLPVWKEGIIKPMVEHYEKEGSELAFFGEVEDPNITWPSTQINWSLTQSPHAMVIGQTRSGKSKTMVSLISTLATAYPRSEFTFADGKGSADYDGFAKVLSKYPVAKLSNGDDPLIELANIIFIGFQEYERRKEKIEQMSQSGYPCSTYVEYNKYVRQDPNLTQEEKEDRIIRRYIICIDEFAEFCQASTDSVEKLLQVNGSIFFIIAKLLRAAASVGITMIIASQRYQNTDFPTPIRSNLTTWMIHNINVRDAGGIGMEGLVEKLPAGRYILRVPGLFCQDTGNNNIRCSMPYIGDDTKAMIEALGRKEIVHEQFNYDLIYNTGKEEDFSKITPPTLLKMIKQTFLVREGYTVINQTNPEMGYISLAFKDEKGALYNLGIVNADEISDYTFADKLVKERKTNEYFDKSRKIFFVTGKVKDAIDLTDHLRSIFGKVNILRELDFERPLKQAMEYYRENNKTKIFHTLLNIEIEERTDAAPLFTPKYKDKNINLAELERIRHIESPVEKGDAFEDWFLLFEKRMGFNTVKARSLVDEGIIPNIFASKRAEGGFDLIRWIDKDKMIAVGIQLKNQPSKNLNGEVIDKTVKSRLLYQDAGLQIRDTLLVTTGALTKQAYGEATAVGVRVVNGEQLNNMVKEYEEMQPGSDSLKKEIDSYDLIAAEDEEAPFLVDEEADQEEMEFDDEASPVDYGMGDESEEDLEAFEKSLAEDNDQEMTHEEKLQNQEAMKNYLASMNKDKKPKG